MDNEKYKWCLLGSVVIPTFNDTSYCDSLTIEVVYWRWYVLLSLKRGMRPMIPITKPICCMLYNLLDKWKLIYTKGKFVHVDAS